MSKGMQRQAALMLALSTCPKYLLLDEAFDGLDFVKSVKPTYAEFDPADLLEVTFLDAYGRDLVDEEKLLLISAIEALG
jgi:hypothetical protein